MQLLNKWKINTIYTSEIKSKCIRVLLDIKFYLYFCYNYSFYFRTKLLDVQNLTVCKQNLTEFICYIFLLIRLYIQNLCMRSNFRSLWVQRFPKCLQCNSDKCTWKGKKQKAKLSDGVIFWSCSFLTLPIHLTFYLI